MSDEPNGSCDFNLKTRAGVTAALEDIGKKSLEQKVPTHNLNIAIRAVNGGIRLAELDMRYQMFVAKTTGTKEVKPIQLLESAT